MIRVLLFLASAKFDYLTSAAYPQHPANAHPSRLLLQIVAIQRILDPLGDGAGASSVGVHS